MCKQCSIIIGIGHTCVCLRAYERTRVRACVCVHLGYCVVCAYVRVRACARACARVYV